MLKAVIFDIDGVLVDSFEANLEFFRAIFKKAGYHMPTAKQYRTAFHLTMKDVIKLYSETNDKKELERILEIAYKTRYPIEKFKLPKNSVEVVKKLSKKYKLALVTGRMKKGVDNYLNFSKTEKYFEVIVHSDHYKNPKPHPEPILMAAKRLKIKPSEAIYIGDSYTDIQAAKAAGMRIILYSKKELIGTDYRVSTFWKILPIIKKL
jgi:HAD superfamily hydrolase (TIGR01509 family)